MSMALKDAGRRSVLGQGAMLTAGLGAAQLLSFARNALLGHLLSKGDFGIAASLTLTLQMLEMLSDVAADRMIVSARHGANRRMVDVGHALLVARGVVVAALLLACAPVMGAYFRVPEATWAFAALALVPIIKAFSHLDIRRAQRRLDNRGVMLVEFIPQLVALFATVPLYLAAGDFSVVLWVALLQALTSLGVSHWMAAEKYSVRWHAGLAGQFLAFGWPILLSALPLMAVYQGERLIVAGFFPIEEFGAYSAAFMLTMVPGLLVAKVGLSLMLPLFSETTRQSTAPLQSFQSWADVTTLAALAYLFAFWFAGGFVLELAFGPNFSGYGDVVRALAIMWAIRMLQGVPGALLMAHGVTLGHLVVGIVRALAIGLVLAVALHGGTLGQLAMAGALGEVLAALTMVGWAGRIDRTCAFVYLHRVAAMVGVIIVLTLLPALFGDLPAGWTALLVACIGAASIAALAVAPLRRIAAA